MPEARQQTTQDATVHGSVYQVIACGDVTFQTPSDSAIPEQANALTEEEREVLETLRGMSEFNLTHCYERLAALTVSPISSLDHFRLTLLSQWCREHEAWFIEDMLKIRAIPDPERADLFRSANNAFESDLFSLIRAQSRRLVVVLGLPGGGKTALLQRLQVKDTWSQIRQSQPRIAHLVRLRHYRSSGLLHTDPLEWLCRSWRMRYPRLVDFETLLADGRVLLLFDGLNELPHSDRAEWRDRVLQWKSCIHEIMNLSPGNRVVVSCRGHDYEITLGSDEEPVLHTEIQALTTQQVTTLLSRGSDTERKHHKASRDSLTGVISTPLLLDIIRRCDPPYAHSLDRAALVTTLVRSLIRRELDRDNSHLLPGRGLLSASDHKRLNRPVPWAPYDLPTSGTLIAGLEALALTRRPLSIQANMIAEPGMATEHAPRNHRQDPEQIAAAGIELNLLTEDFSSGEICFAHEVIEEYFAGRALARRGYLDLVNNPIQMADQESLGTSKGSGVWPPVSSRNRGIWDDTVVMAFMMQTDRDTAVEELASVNLSLATRCVIEPGILVSERVKKSIQSRLMTRTVDESVDADSRLEATYFLGMVGDPRFVRRSGQLCSYVEPPMAEIPGGEYLIGEDNGDDDCRPAHIQRIADFAIGRYPVTNAEYACFIESGGYDDERWWPTIVMAAWRRGHHTRQGYRAHLAYWCEHLDEATVTRMHEAGTVSAEETESFLALLRMSDEERTLAFLKHHPDEVLDVPEYWADPRFSCPNQPVVGISQYEAMAYCHWLSAQTDETYRLPTEVEWEAAARGAHGSMQPCIDHTDRHRYDVRDWLLRCPTPVGAFTQCHNEFGVFDLCGNVTERTKSVYGVVEPSGTKPYRYPYDSHDGREDTEASEKMWWVAKGANWRSLGHAVTFRSAIPSTVRPEVVGFRIVRTNPGVTGIKHT